MRTTTALPAAPNPRAAASHGAPRGRRREAGRGRPLPEGRRGRAPAARLGDRLPPRDPQGGDLEGPGQESLLHPHRADEAPRTACPGPADERDVMDTNKETTLWR